MRWMLDPVWERKWLYEIYFILNVTLAGGSSMFLLAQKS